MMEQCPLCRQYSVALDGYRGIYRCMEAGCSCVVIDNSSYSHLKADPSARTISRVMVVDGVEKEVLKEYEIS